MFLALWSLQITVSVSQNRPIQGWWTHDFAVASFYQPFS